MGKPHHHAKSSVRKYGGQPHDYLEIHKLLDSSKQAMADNRHRALTHNSWFICHILPQIYGDTIINSDGVEVSVIDIAEQHVLEDFGGRFIPTVQDYLVELPIAQWINGQDLPPSRVQKREDLQSVTYTFH